MPIALYPELIAALRRTARAAAPWSRLVGIETQLLRRAQGAFLAHWFGPNVPEKQLSLRIAIRNLDALSARYALARRSLPPPPSELSLLGPLAGIGGLIVGMALSPPGIMLLSPFLDQIGQMLSEGWQGHVVTLLMSLLLAPGLAVALGIPIALVHGLGQVLSGDRMTLSLVGLLGEAGQLIDRLARFWDQLSGREPIRNPVVGRILRTLDRFAGLFVQMLGLVGLLVVRVAPLIPGLLAQYRALAALIEAAMAALEDIFNGIGEALLAPFTGTGGLIGVLTGIVDGLMAIPALIVDPVARLLAGAVTELTAAWQAISIQVTAFATGFAERLAEAFGATPLAGLVARITSLLGLMPEVVATFRSIPAAASASGGTPLQQTLRSTLAEIFTGGIVGPGVGSRVADVMDAAGRLSLPPLPDISLPTLPAAPTLPDLDALLAANPRPEIPDIEALATELIGGAFAAARSRPVPPSFAAAPASAFADARRRLEAAGPPPSLGADDLRLRDLIYAAVGRLLPPALRIYAPDVRAMFDRIDREVYRREPAAGAQATALPQQELGDSGRLRPVVHDLRLVVARGEMPDLRAFRDLVVEAVQSRTYIALGAR